MPAPIRRNRFNSLSAALFKRLSDAAATPTSNHNQAFPCGWYHDYHDYCLIEAAAIPSRRNAVRAHVDR